MMLFSWRRKWHPTPVFLPRESRGQRSLVGCCPRGSHRVGHNWSDLACMRALEKEMATHSSGLAWRILGTEEPGGLLSMGSHRVGHDWSDLAAAAGLIFYSATETFSISIIRLFSFFIIHVFTGVALLISFKNFSFAFASWLTGARGLAFSISLFLTCLP